MIPAHSASLGEEDYKVLNFQYNFHTLNLRIFTIAGNFKGKLRCSGTVDEKIIHKSKVMNQYGGIVMFSN